MSLKTLIESQATTVFLQAGHFVEAVTHRPEGVAANDVSVDALVDLPPSTEETDRGVGMRLRGTLVVAAAVVVTDRDRWLIRGMWFECERVEPVEFGLRAIQINATQTYARTAEGRTSRQP